jgi:5'-nucleotidase/UDP-sugar diphosphatase
MTRSFQFGLLTASLLALSSGAAFADYQLNLLHINDFHSRIEPINKFDSTCSAEEEGKKECFGGAARLKTAIDQRRAALSGQNVLLLNAGDNFQGSLFYTTYKGAAEAEFLNDMKFDVMTVGNHEFDDSEDGLATFLDKVKFPVISANVLAADGSKLGDRIKPSLVLDVGGQKIGIVGAVTNDTEEISSPGPKILIADDVQTITAAVEDLRADPRRLPARSRRHRQDPGCRCRRRRPLAQPAVEHRPEGRRAVPDDGGQPRRLQGAGRSGGVLQQVSRRSRRRLRR